jgi:hypothetical protein
MKPVHALIALLALLLLVQTCRLRNSQEYGRDQWFRADSAQAAADTTRAVSAKVAKLLGDSVRGFERRAIQEKQERDALDKALKRERAARVALTVTVPEVKTTAPVVSVSDSGDIRRGKFLVRKEPFTVSGAIELPKPPGDGKLDMNIALDPLRLNLRLGCSQQKQQGLRTATTSVFGPSWASIALDTVSQTREVCNPAKPKRSVLRSAVLIGLGFLGGWVLKP